MKKLLLEGEPTDMNGGLPLEWKIVVANIN